MSDPFDGLEVPTLAEQLEPHRVYGDDELAVSLLTFGKMFGGTGISTPAHTGFDYWCEDCEQDVRGVTRPGESLLACPLCGREPGALTLGRGPKARTDAGKQVCQNE